MNRSAGQGISDRNTCSPLRKLLFIERSWNVLSMRLDVDFSSLQIQEDSS